MNSIYTPTNWYWIVAGDQTKAFSSAVGDYVPANDATFVAWKAAGNSPTNIESAASLGQVLAAPLARPVESSVLDGYTTEQARLVGSHLVFKIIFNHENRIRALEGKAPITAQQAIAAIKALM